MKILYLVHQFYPKHYTGTEKFLLNLSTMMQKWGNIVKVISYGFYDDDFYDDQHGDVVFKEITYKGVPILVFRCLSPWNADYDLEHPVMRDFVREVIRKEKPDIVHVAHPMRMGEFIHGVAEREIPYLLTLTDFFLMCPKIILQTSQNTLCWGPEGGKTCNAYCSEYRQESIRTRLSVGKSILEGASIVISPSTFLANTFQKEYPDIGFDVIPHGIDFSVIKRNKHQHGDSGEVVFCYAGQLSIHKGVDVLIEAFRRVTARNIRLKLYGDGSADVVKQLKNLADDDGRIEFCGVYTPNQIGDIYTGVDVVVMPSNWHENNPIVLNEAFACRVPMIVSDAGALVDRVKNQFNGFIFEMGNVNQLAGILSRISRSPNILNPLKTNLKTTLIPTLEKEAITYSGLYNDILRNSMKST